jgi:glycine/D-amino acid oxidase-like deaminating enzyme
MSIRITGSTVVVKKAAIETGFRGGIVAYEAMAPAPVRKDDELIGVAFDDGSAAESWAQRLAMNGLTDVAVIDATHPIPHGWLDVQPGDGTEDAAASLRPVRRFDVLSRSDSGLHYVRERRGGVMRVLTTSELADFDDPPPCPRCAEQFGCEHFNCAGEPLFTEAEIVAEVPKEWTAFARDYGLSRADLERLLTIKPAGEEGEFHTTSADPDMRTLELVLLLNDAR